MGFFDSFLNPGASDIKKGAKKADQFYTQGLEQAVPHYEQGRARLDPFATSGTQANAMYSAALGLEGPEAQENFMATYREGPMVDLLQRNVSRALAARGLSDSGTARLAAGRVALEDYNNHLNRMFQVSEAGRGAATTQGQFDTGIGDMRFGTAQLRAGNQINKHNALAQSRQAGVNNILGAVGTGVKAAGMFV